MACLSFITSEIYHVGGDLLEHTANEQRSLKKLDILKLNFSSVVVFMNYDQCLKGLECGKLLDIKPRKNGKKFINEKS